MSTNQKVVLTDDQKSALTVDATNRAARTAYVQLAIDVAVAVTLFVSTTFATATGWDEFDWKVLGFSLVKTVIATIGAFVMRRFMDHSGIPTPLPPSPVPQPSVPIDGGDDEPVAELPEPEPILEREIEEHEYDGTYPAELDVEGDGDHDLPATQMRGFAAAAEPPERDWLAEGIARDNERFPGGGE